MPGASPGDARTTQTDQSKNGVPKMFNKIRFIAVTLTAIVAMMFGASVQANAAETATFDDGLDTYLWYTDTNETGIDLTDVDTVYTLATNVPYCEAAPSEYVACYAHTGDPETDVHMVDTLYWCHTVVTVTDDTYVSISYR